MSLCLKCHKKAEIKCKQCSENFCKLDWPLDHGPNCIPIAGKNGKPTLVFCSQSNEAGASMVANLANDIFQPYFPDCEVIGSPGADLETMRQLAPDVIFVLVFVVGARPSATTAARAYMEQFKKICKNVMFLQLQQAASSGNYLTTFEPQDYDGGFALGTKKEKRLAPRLLYNSRTSRLTRNSEGQDLIQNVTNLRILQENITRFASQGFVPPKENPQPAPQAKPQPAPPQAKPQPAPSQPPAQTKPAEGDTELLRKEIERQSSYIALLEAQNSNLKEQITKLEDQNNSLKNQITALENELTKVASPEKPAKPCREKEVAAIVVKLQNKLSEIQAILDK